MDAVEVKLSSDSLDNLSRLHALYSNIQVQADTIYHQRTSVVTLTQGLLFVAFNELVDQPEWVAANLVLSCLGVLLALMWMAVEQRNHVFFRGRAETLRQLEERIEVLAQEADLEFRSFWTAVPAWVKTNAKWYERFSAQAILRVWIPAMFVGAWAILAVVALQATPEPGVSASEVEAADC